MTPSHVLTDDSLDLAAEVRVDEVCLRFEAAWKMGPRPCLEDFLADFTGPERRALLRELIVLDACYRRSLKEVPRPADYQQRFPEVDDTWLAGVSGEESSTHSRATLAWFPGPRPATVGAPRPVDVTVAGPLADYDRLELLGRGGMGVVYRARQVRLNRTVALKMIRAGDLADAADLERFRTEAEVVARLRHPNILQIYEVGEHQGRPFLSLEFCGGGTLNEKLNGIPLAARAAAQLLETLARAMQAAHEHQVIHRDLKPANVLLTEDGTPKITDFGLAKKLDEAGQTHSGAVLGTPSYMAPEQASGKREEIGPAADVYALGAILYECLTGRPPFRAATVHDTLVQVRDDEPVPTRRLQSKCPRDLETVCLKCLHKAPSRRYPSAAALADDLARFLRGEPVSARPVGRVERLGRWCQRHPAQALAAFLLSMTLVLGLLGGSASWQWQQADARRQLAEEARDALAVGEKRTAGALAVAQAAQGEEEQQRRRAETAQALVDRLLYFSDVQLTQRAWEAGEFGPMSDLLDDLGKGRGGKADIPGFEYHYLRSQCRLSRTLRGHGWFVLGVSWSPDGQRLASAAFDMTVRVWDVDTGKETRVLGHPAMVRHVSWSPDNKRLASACADSLVRVWDADTGKELLTLQAKPGPANPNPAIWRSRDVEGVSWSPDGQRLASASSDWTVRLWDVASGKETHLLAGHTAAVNAVRWSRDGNRLASASEDGTVRIWNADDGKEVGKLKGHVGAVSGVSWGPDNRHLASASADQTVRIWDVKNGKEVRTLKGHTDAVAALSWAPDGKRLASASKDRTVRVWDTATGKEILTLLGHTDLVWDVSWGPDGQHLGSASQDRTVRIWDVATREENRQLNGHTREVNSVSWSPDGQRLASASDEGTVRVWNRDTGEQTLALQGCSRCANWNADGQRLASASDDGAVRVWDTDTGKEVLVLKGHTQKVFGLCWSPDGKRLASAADDRTVRVWDMASGKEALTLHGHTAAVNAVSWSRDGRRLASASNDMTVRVWDAATGKEVGKLNGHTSAVNAVCWSPDSRRLASASWDGTVRLWDADGAWDIQVLKGHSESVTAVDWSPDGRRLASAAEDKTVRLWDANTGKTALVLKRHTAAVNAVSWSPDGRRLASASSDKTVQVWDGTPLPAP